MEEHGIHKLGWMTQQSLWKIQSPLSEPQEVLVALLADLSGPNDSSTEENWKK